MKKRGFVNSRKISVVCGLLLFLDAPRVLMGEPTAAATAAFTTYAKAVEVRLTRQHRSQGGFLVGVDGNVKNAETRLRGGELIIEPVKEPNVSSAEPEFFGALLHHWRGTAFVRGAKAADFERLMQDFSTYPQHFFPEVVKARVVTQDGDLMQAWMQVRQQHVITVVLDTSYDINYGHLDLRHGYSASYSTRIAEVNAPGTSAERTLSASEEHGFLWRLNTYWSYEERDGGLYMQIEAVSLTRSIPTGLGWMIGPYVESIPRESLEFTLRSACNALQK